MILSNVEIQRALLRGHLEIEPRPQPDMPTRDGPECPYQTSSVDLHLGDEVARFNEGDPVNIDLRHGGFAKYFARNSSTVQISEEQPFALKPHTFALAKTRERIGLPLPPHESEICLAARVEGRSSFARCGLLVHCTAPTIHAGFRGTITLELVNNGPYTISLYPGMAICQLIVEQVAGRPFQNDSQFQGQGRPGGLPGG